MYYRVYAHIGRFMKISHGLALAHEKCRMLVKIRYNNHLNKSVTARNHFTRCTS